MIGIKRNTKALAKVIETAREMYAYTLDNNFTPQACNAKPAGEIVRDTLAKFRSAYVYFTPEAETYTLHVHGNYWLEFKAEGAELVKPKTAAA